MSRIAALFRFPRSCIPLIIFRWLLLLLAFGTTLRMHDAAGWQPAAGPIPALSYATFYLIIWTFRLPSLARLRRGRVVLIAADLLLSMSVVWLAGDWGYGLTPFALSALILPGAWGGWPAAAAAVLAYLGIDTSYRFLVQPASLHLVVQPALIADYLRPIIAASIWPLAVAVHRRWPIYRWREPAVSRQPVRSRDTLVGPQRMPNGDFGPRLLPGARMERRTDRLPSATLERRAVRVASAVRQVIAEAQQHGMQIVFEIEGREPTLPPSYPSLLAKAVDIALENIRQHAHTDQATVRLQLTPLLLSLTVRDYGNGLLDGTAEPPGFRQLRLLRYRLQEVSGTLEITEPNDDGVLFAVTLPVPT